jgi:hypothetical protein
MPSVKISELPVLTQLSANNANTVFVVVDKTTNTTSQFSTTVLAQGLYANNILNVGTANTGLLLPNSVAQFISNTAIFSQVNFQNINSKGSGDIVITADNGDNSNNYLDLGVQGSNMDADSSFDLPNNDGYLYMHGRDAQKQGNLWIGTATSNTDLIFFTGDHKQANEVARIEDGVGLSLKMPIKFVDGTTQNTAASAAAVTLAAQANTIITQGVDVTQNTRLNSIETVNVDQNTSISIIQGVNTTQNTNITTANNHAWAAFAKANNALANTTGTFNGDLTITGNTFAQAMNTANFQVIGTANVSGTLNVVGAVAMNSTLVLANSTFSATEAAFRITAAGSSQTPTQAGTLIQLTNKPNVPARMLIDSFGTSNTAYSIIAGRTARGTVDAPTATQNNDILLRIAGNSYGTTGYAPFGDARIDFVATENHSDTNRGSRIRFWNTPNGSNVVNEIASFNADSVYFTGTVAPEKGFIYSPTVLVGNQTAFTIDFSTTSLIKATLAADCTISLSNYVFGKVVEVWLTNTGGPGRTITHGCTATNSTVNSTTFTIAGTASAYLRYFSIDGDNANTFVTIQYA